MKVTIIDHHIIPVKDFVHDPKVKVVVGFDQDNYYQNVSEYVNKRFDYVFLDENPDAMLGTMIYMLSQNNQPMYKCLPRALSEPDFEKLEQAGKEHIVIFNCLKAYESDFSKIDEIFLVNPYESGMQNLSIAQILYRTLENPTEFMRDLASISIVLDYTLDEALETIVEVVRAYPEIFEDVAEKIRTVTLNKFNIHDSKFDKLASMYRSPSILYGIKGVDQFIDITLNNLHFTFSDIINKTPNPVTDYLSNCIEEYSKILEKEFASFEEEKEEIGPIIIYEPHYRSVNFLREFANMIKDRNIQKVIMFKTPAKNNQTKYSFRRGELNIDLGQLMMDMGVGGGNPYAAGCTISDGEEFEEAFFEEINKLNLD